MRNIVFIVLASLGIMLGFNSCIVTARTPAPPHPVYWHFWHFHYSPYHFYHDEYSHRHGGGNYGPRNGTGGGRKGGTPRR